MTNDFTPYELTGARRFRSERRWGREQLVLQVQERGHRTTNLGGYIDTETTLRWRDARTTDLPVNLEGVK